MTYKFDPMYWNGTIFSLDKTWEMASGWMDYRGQNLPIPASFFPKSLTFDGASAPLPDIHPQIENRPMRNHEGCGVEPVMGRVDAD